MNAAIERAVAYDKRARKLYQQVLASTSKAAGPGTQSNENIEETSGFSTDPRSEASPSSSKPISESARDRNFVSYSHKDRKLFDEFKTMLAPAILNGVVDFWDDTRIKPGARWKDQIQRALKAVKVGVLLVSNHFLESDFIVKHELPLLLKAARDEGATIFWIYLSPCHYELSEIETFQAAHDVSRPLNGLTKPKRQEVLKKIGGDLIRLAQSA